jgi:hypothetical protein
LSLFSATKEASQACGDTLGFYNVPRGGQFLKFLIQQGIGTLQGLGLLSYTREDGLLARLPKRHILHLKAVF